MRTILSLFSRSPFTFLQTHMNKVNDCVKEVPKMFEALVDGDFATIDVLVKKTSKLEHLADIAKQDIRNHLPKRMFLPVDRGAVLEVLTMQDSIADKAENIGVLLTYRQLTMPSGDFLETFQKFLDKNIDSFDTARLIVEEIDVLLQSSFGGVEAEKVKRLVDEVALKEHEADVLQRTLLQLIFDIGDKMTPPIFSLWQHLFGEISGISNISEKLAYKVRTMLDIS